MSTRRVTRRGVSTESAIVLLAVFAIVFLILVIAYKQLFGELKDEFTERECQLSLLATKAVDSAQPACMLKVTNPVPLKCNRDFTLVTDDEVRINGRDVTASVSDTCPSGVGDCRAHRTVAQSMQRCWQLMLEGKQPILQQTEINEANFFAKTDKVRACFICDEITLQTSTDVEEFVAYLKVEKYRDGTFYSYLAQNDAWCDPDFKQQEYTSKGMTCWDVLGTGVEKAFGRDWLSPDSANITPTTLAKGKTYAITFVRRGLSSCEGKSSQDSDYIHPYLTFGVYPIPVEKLNDACQTVIV
jgi:hypothetical protein